MSTEAAKRIFPGSSGGWASPAAAHVPSVCREHVERGGTRRERAEPRLNCSEGLGGKQPPQLGSSAASGQFKSLFPLLESPGSPLSGSSLWAAARDLAHGARLPRRSLPISNGVRRNAYAFSSGGSASLKHWLYNWPRGGRGRAQRTPPRGWARPAPMRLGGRGSIFHAPVRVVVLEPDQRRAQ